MESFPVYSGKIQKLVNVYSYDPEFVTLSSIKQYLPGVHLAWIFNRMLTALAFTHRCGWVHGAVTPDHFMVRPRDHAGRLIGWGQSVQIGDRVKVISSRWKDLYPPEVLGKTPASAETDIFMAAKTLISISGGDVKANTMPNIVHPKIQTFIKSCLLAGRYMRPNDAIALVDEWREMLATIYGPPRFVVLEL